MTNPSATNVARWILRYAVRIRKVGPGEAAMEQWYYLPLAHVGWQMSDFHFGLALAEEKLWIVRQSNGVLLITQSGHDEALR